MPCSEVRLIPEGSNDLTKLVARQRCGLTLDLPAMQCPVDPCLEEIVEDLPVDRLDA
jgi:hypothetical protein